MVALTIALINPVPKMDPELGQQPASDKGTQDSDDKVADESEAGPLHDLAGEPAGNEANKQMTNRLSLDMCIW
jgi:hypothetical protein